MGQTDVPLARARKNVLPRRRLKIVLKGTALFIAAALICGILYEQLGRQRDRRRLPQIGRSVDIGGRTLNIFCSGTGSPAVIFEAASGIGLEWQSVQTQVAKFTEACWYDRAGMGWSETGPFPRTSAAIAGDLHELLRRAEVSSPYVLVGFSFGGLPMRKYAGLYPDEVAGVVLVDSAHEDELLRAPKFYLAHTAPRFLWHSLDLAVRTAAVVGLFRITQSSAGLKSKNLSQMSDEEVIAALRQEPKSLAAGISTGIVEPESYAEAGAVRDLGNLPLIVLTAGQPEDFHDQELNRQAAAYQQIWIHEMQAKLARLSTRGRQIVVENSDHDIPSRASDAVIAAIRDVVIEVRGETANH
jgi:pimeloyl-ACP methyl ester carboxylesterase